MLSNLLQSIRCCPTCGKPNVRKEFLCSHCLDIFENRVKLNRIYIKDLKAEVFSLLIWNKDDLFTVRLIYSLKKGVNVAGFKLMANTVNSLGLSIKNTCLIPIPPSKKTKTDHALEFSRQLSTIYKIPLINEVLSETTGKQKSRTKTQREKTHFSLRKLNKSVSLVNQLDKHTDARGDGLVLVDDVVTTGSTLRAAARLYEKTTEIKAITIAYRPYFGSN